MYEAISEYASPSTGEKISLGSYDTIDESKQVITTYFADNPQNTIPFQILRGIDVIDTLYPYPK